MPTRNRNQHKARETRRMKRELRKKHRIPSGIIMRHSRGKVKISMQVEASGTTKPALKTYKLVLTRSPEDDEQRTSWIRSIQGVFGKTEREARNMFSSAGGGDQPTLASSADIEKIASLKRLLTWSLRDAVKMKEG